MEMLDVFEPPNVICQPEKNFVEYERVVLPLLFHVSDLRILRITPVQNQLSASLLPKNIKMKIHRTIVFRVDSYGCETWSVTLREEHRLRVFENKIPRKVSGPERYEGTGEQKGLHNELYDLYCSLNIVWVIT